MTDFNAMGKNELRAACKAAGISYGKLNNEGMRGALAALEAASLTPAPEKKAKAKKQSKKTVDKHTGTGITIQKDRETKNGVTRPSAGGKCASVWDYLDRLKVEGTTPTMTLINEEAQRSGINEYTMRTQYAAWRKFNGIVGRAK